MSNQGRSWRALKTLVITPILTGQALGRNGPVTGQAAMLALIACIFAPVNAWLGYDSWWVLCVAVGAGAIAIIALPIETQGLIRRQIDYLFPGMV